ncbi:transporter [Dyella amyloliquefaciens]|uniref:transporter n=1 Tax=Dyella amyloliquefaciens TaxID=1770545 RepID=UPI001E31E6D9|nr:transporter [Dyella amyloliquefaciens]
MTSAKNEEVPVKFHHPETRFARRLAFVALAWLAGSLPLPTHALGAGEDAYQQSRQDAWWTGPMLANTPETGSPGHFLAEPYLYDVRTPHASSFGSRTYLVYGLADNFGVGIIPVFGYNRVENGPNSSGVGLGDFTLQAQYQFTHFQDGSWVPSTALMVQETLPTGKYDQLGSRPADGMGSGVYTTTLGFNAQTYLWMPNGRILRLRLNLTASFSSSTGVHGVSVYGTSDSFHGRAKPGNSYGIDVAAEYSLTRNWVLAMDGLYNHNGNTQVTGADTVDPFGGPPLPRNLHMNSGTSDYWGVAPAIEYNWTPNIGVLLGTRVIFGGHHTSSSITPAIALNYVH